MILSSHNPAHGRPGLRRKLWRYERETGGGNPILYDSLIRRFQTPAEREAEGKEKGYARVLEGSLLRGEEKLARLAVATATDGSSGTEGGEESLTPTVIEGQMDRQSQTTRTVTQPPSQTIPTLDEPTSASTNTTSGMFATFTTPVQQPLPRFGGLSEPSSSSSTAYTNINQTPQSPPLPAATTAVTTTGLSSTLPVLTGTDTPAQTREEGLDQWTAFLRERFVRGEDEDFDYRIVDCDDELDTLERREEEEAWFDEEEPDWASDGSDGEEKAERVLEGETGVQDF
ncbi:coiled-coil domain-containing protein-domain-containing protein [Neurospora hispaniola]|uniref:Coiled-coil domain-containing protein-domain-containing protein n=1 Tax=Neurospora hispaniola TaxID=588809 RepID=A0AAJ0I3I4_9PEZI|nr:coiled-coil domain-containing protein-domain-containing protein [Neurospora hispaniola]